MTEIEITVRRLRESDPDLAAVAADLNGADAEFLVRSFSESSLRRFLSDPLRFYVAAFAGTELAGAVHGYCLVHPAGPIHLYVDEVDTVASHRRRGVATAMLRAVFHLAGEYGASDVWLATEEDNVAAIALYRSLRPSEVEHGPTFTFSVHPPSGR